MLGLHNILVNTASLADGQSIAAYLTSASSDLITSTTIGAKVHSDTKGPSEFLEGSTFTAGTDYLSAMGAVDESGNWEPLNINAAGELLVNAAVTFTAEHNEDDPAGDGFSGIATLLVRQDTLAVSTSANDDFGAFKSNNLGELYVFDTTTHTTLTSILNELQATNYAEDSVAPDAFIGVPPLAVRRDTTGTTTSANGDFSEFQTWSNGELKTVDIANSTILQQQVSVTSTAAAVPTTALVNRKTLMLQNTSANKIWIGSSTVTTSGATAGIEMPANSFMELDIGPAIAVYAIKSGAGSLNLNLMEAS